MDTPIRSLSDEESQLQQIGELLLHNGGDPLISVGVMNQIFGAGTVGKTQDAYFKRLCQFQDIFEEEVLEGNEILAKLILGGTAIEDIEVEMADWLGDMIIYCVSEMFRWNLPVHAILNIIMASNFSKLDDDGKAIWDERKKMLKGLHYWKPEPQIKRYLADIKVAALRQTTQETAVDQQSSYNPTGA